jgi:hypothetical protein
LCKKGLFIFLLFSIASTPIAATHSEVCSLKNVF